VKVGEDDGEEASEEEGGEEAMDQQ